MTTLLLIDLQRSKTFSMCISFLLKTDEKYTQIKNGLYKSFVYTITTQSRFTISQIRTKIKYLLTHNRPIHHPLLIVLFSLMLTVYLLLLSHLYYIYTDCNRKRKANIKQFICTAQFKAIIFYFPCSHIIHLPNRAIQS